MNVDQTDITFGKESFIGRVKGNITDHYTFGKLLGEGGYGKVYRVINNTTGEIRACKQLSKSKIKNIPQFNLEIDLLIQLDHPHIIKLYEVFEDKKNIYILMEECTGGELFDRIINHAQKRKMYTEREAAKIFEQIMSAIAYCHASKVCHRDIKPENILLLNSAEDSQLKLIDFGLSKKFSKTGDILTTQVGSVYYVSPEVLQGSYDQGCDIWASGVILYMLLSGIPPFQGKNDSEIWKKIVSKKFTFPDKYFGSISKDAKDLISKMLCEPENRLTAEQVLAHTWIADLAPNSTEELLNFNIEALQNYLSCNKLKKAVLTFIATRLKDNEIQDLHAIFEAIDQNKNGSLTLQEFYDGLNQLNLQDTTIDIKQLFDSLDTDKSGEIAYTEFLAATIDRKQYLKNERLLEAFRAFDVDNSGKISKKDIEKLFHAEQLGDKIDEIMKNCDFDGDGEIDLPEFVIMMENANL